MLCAIGIAILVLLAFNSGLAAIAADLEAMDARAEHGKPLPEDNIVRMSHAASRIARGQ